MDANLQSYLTRLFLLANRPLLNLLQENPLVNTLRTLMILPLQKNRTLAELTNTNMVRKRTDLLLLFLKNFKYLVLFPACLPAMF